MPLRSLFSLRWLTARAKGSGPLDSFPSMSYDSKRATISQVASTRDLRTTCTAALSMP